MRVRLFGLLALAFVLVLPGLARAQADGGLRISNIRVEGSQRIEPETVQSYLTVKPGDLFEADTIDKSLKSLFATGLFADVAITRDRSDLVVKVVENPIINRLAFEGNRKIETKTLEAETQLRPRIVYTRTKVQSDVKRLLDLYRRAGRFAATVEPKVIQLDQNRVDLVFEINEGPVTGIGRIIFIGNKRYGDNALRSELQTKESRWYRFLSTDDRYDPDRVTYDRELLRRFYLRNGYADFRVLSAVAELSPDQDSFYLTFTLEEGERYKFGKIDVTSPIKELPAEDLRKELRMSEGDWYNAEKIDDTVKRLTDAAGSKGYAFVDVEPVLKRDRDAKVIGIEFQLKEGPKVYVERIDIVGNVRTLDSVVRREFELVEGDAFNTSRLKRSEKRLKDLGFFKKAEITNTAGTTPDKTVLTAKVEEQSTGELTLGAGYSSDYGALTEIGVRERNLLGRGQDIRANALIAQKKQSYDTSFTEPYFLDRNLSATISAFKTDNNFQRSASYNYETVGGSVGFGYRLTENLRQSVRYILRQDSINGVDANASVYIRDEVGERISSIVGQDLFYDRLDSRQDPSEGYFLSEGNDFAGAGGDVHYVRTRARAGVYFPVMNETNLSFRAETGYVHALSEKLRINDRFFLGASNLRGFEYGGVGPRDKTTGDSLGGNFYYSGTAELKFPLGLPKELGIAGRAFTDIGSNYGIDVATTNSGNIADKSSIRMSAGVGISWKSPFGPVIVDVARPIMKEDFDKTELIRFNFGTKF